MGFIMNIVKLLLSLTIKLIQSILYLFITFSGLGLWLLWYYQSYILYMPSGPEYPQIPIISQLLRQSKPLQRSNQYNPIGMRLPSDYGLRYEIHNIETHDKEKLHCWLILQPESISHNCATIIFYHGNALNIGIRLYNAKQLHDQCRVNILLVDYRGYGDSTGQPTEYGLKLDIHATIHYISQLNNTIDTEQIYLFGRSLGGACAIYGCSMYSNMIRGCIVENTFTSIHDMAIVIARQILQQYTNIQDDSIIYTLLSKFLNIFMTSHWRTIDIISDITTPLLVISGSKDELVPQTQHKQLYDNAKQSKYKQLYVVNNGTHNDTYMIGGTDYYKTIKQFIDKCKSITP